MCVCVRGGEFFSLHGSVAFVKSFMMKNDERLEVTYPFEFRHIGGV